MVRNKDSFGGELRNEQDEKKESDEEEIVVERLGGSELKATDRATYEEISEDEEKYVSVRDEDEKVSDSERWTEADSAEEADDGENKGTESGDPPFIPAGPHGMFLFPGLEDYALRLTLIS